MPASTAQCCPFFQSQRVVECSYTADTLLGQTDRSRLPWLPVHFPFSFRPSCRFSSSCVSAGWASGAPIVYIPAANVRALLCVSRLGLLSFKSRDRLPDYLGWGGALLLPDSICFFFPVSCLEAPIPSGQGLSPVLDSKINYSHGFQAPLCLSQAMHISKIILCGLSKTEKQTRLVWVK